MHRALVIAWIMLASLVLTPILGTTLSSGPASIEVETRAAAASQYRLIAENNATMIILPGQSYVVTFDSQNQVVTPQPPPPLPQECRDALASVPEWMRTNLTYKFYQLSNDLQVTYGNLIKNTKPPYTDEVAFCVAHLPVSNLQSSDFYPELLVDNAKLVYSNDLVLRYIDLVEHENYTTAVYYLDGNVSVELDRDMYYWYVVNPKMSDELPTYVDPNYDYLTTPPFDKNHGTPPPTGKFWRDWLFEHQDPAGYYNGSSYGGRNLSNPLLKDLLDDCTTLYDAIDACNNWVGNSLLFDSDYERPIQPVRIYAKHMGRCGEHQDMRNAIARVGLIPCTSTLNSAEDHVWNEFWERRWIHWDGGYDSPMMYENGWGKKISSVWNMRPDSDIWPVTPKYTPYCNFTATVLDSAGLPVDGAHVNILTENYYSPDTLTTTTWGTTDLDGKVTIPLGDQRNYWASAETSGLGNTPASGQSVSVITNSVTGEEYAYTFDLMQSAPALKAVLSKPTEGPNTVYRCEVDYEVMGSITNTRNSYTGEIGDYYREGGSIDYFFADQSNFNRYQNGLQFTALNLSKRIHSDTTSVPLDSGGTYNAVLSNEYSQASAKIVRIHVMAYAKMKIHITQPKDTEQKDLGSVVRITGTTWSEEGISRVLVNYDNSTQWLEATSTADPRQPAYSTWVIDWNTTGLTPGTHSIKAKAEDGHGYVTASITIGLNDVDPPDVIISRPANGTELRTGDELHLEGSVSDNVGVTRLVLVMDGDDNFPMDLFGSLSAGQWSCDLDTKTMEYGWHTFTVTAYDAAKNSGSASVDAKVLENNAPIVLIDSPKNGAMFRLGDDILVKGRASDDSELTKLEFILDERSPVDITNELSGDGTWSYTLATDGSNIEAGSHSLTTIVEDGSYNKGNNSVSIFLDATPPKVDIGSPIDGAIYRAGQGVTVKGNATDNKGVSSLFIRMDDGKDIDITSRLANGQYTYAQLSTKGLSGKTHVITVTAMDIVGHVSEAVVEITIDSQQPSVTISEITAPIIAGQAFNLMGTAIDDTGITFLELDIQGVATKDILPLLKGGIWIFNWDTTDASEGEHVLTLTAMDGFDNLVIVTAKVYVITEDTDTDGDGMPDMWEMKYSKLDKDVPDGDLDTDKDGYTNLEEYTAGTNPTDPASHPKEETKTTSKTSDDQNRLLWIGLGVLITAILIVGVFMLVRGRKG